MDERSPGPSPQERFADLVDDLVGGDIPPPPGGSGFGRGALRCNGKIFAMLTRGRLVVKLPAARVDELVAQAEGDRFDANKGTPMKEWFSLAPDSGIEWPELAREAVVFARGGDVPDGPNAPPSARSRSRTRTSDRKTP